MSILYKLFKQNPQSREGIITITSGLSIAVNLLTAVIKIIIGTLTASIAIISEGVNNCTDALTSILTLLATKLARKHPDAKHPFGYGRLEYLASLAIAVLILVSGSQTLIGSIKLVVQPEELNISYLALVIVATSAVIKFFLGTYTIRMGRKADSSALVGVGVECRNDSFSSCITIVASLIFLLGKINVDAYAGILISLLILRSGLDVLLKTVSDLLGRPGAYDLAKTLYKEIRTTKGVLGAADMMLHNYGPEAWSGSVNVEIDHSLTVGEIYAFLHKLQLRIMHKYHVTMVFGVYAVDNEHEEIRQLRKHIVGFIKQRQHVQGFHALYMDAAHSTIYCDIVVDYELRDWERLEAEFQAHIAQLYPTYAIKLTIETEFV